MDWSDYEVDGQLSIFDLIETQNEPFNPLEALALVVHVRDRKKRIAEYFAKDNSSKNREKFLRNEYGMGGRYSRTDKPYEVFEYEENSKGLVGKWYTVNMDEVTTVLPFSKLVGVIDKMIKDNRYLESEDLK